MAKKKPKKPGDKPKPKLSLKKRRKASSRRKANYV